VDHPNGHNFGKGPLMDFFLFKFHFIPFSIMDQRCTNQVAIVV